MAELSTQLRILELFSQSNSLILGPTDVAAALGTNKGSASEQLAALAAEGYLERVEQAGPGKYRLGRKLFLIGQAFLINRLAEISAIAASAELEARSMVDMFGLNLARLSGGMGQALAVSSGAARPQPGIGQPAGPPELAPGH